ncbi:MAG: substrate-binding domain-containing protein [Spirochaetales bacterium]|nr:substrate-binding domain-containing protein [Spirochaetales bacterium]MCF7939060.1 substrate-binding domain-containing protein [Spirochaetales bacterium]
MKKIILVLGILLLAGGMVFAGGAQEAVEVEQSAGEEAVEAPENPRVKLATTTSTDNSGLLAYLLPKFTEATGYKVDVIAVGTGAALELGEKGDVDVVLVHARAKEDAFVSDGYGVNRKDVMHNDFVLLGPPSDPAGIADAESAAEALTIISENQSDFVSRGDNSGTHFKEQNLWKEAGTTPSGNWYKEAGQGMGAVITMTNNMQGYTLADRGTFIAMRNKIDLEVLFEGDPVLFNPYGIIAVDPDRHPHVNYDGAMALVNWITGKEGQQLIADFRMDGDQLFHPDAM